MLRRREKTYREHVLSDRVAVRLYGPAETNKAVLYVGGAGGGFDTPAQGLYPSLAEELAPLGYGGVRLRFRFPQYFADCVTDILSGVRYLEEAGVTRIGLVGHSLGGAAVIEAGATAHTVTTVVALAPQSFGTDRVHLLRKRPLLLVHGTEDQILPPICSIDIHTRAREPKRIELLEGNRHVLNESAGEVRDMVRAWLIEHV